MRFASWKTGLAMAALALFSFGPASASVPKMVWTEEFGATW
ncbi:MAG: hypothetical protein U0527_16595 [Candidatus Eisenbacteria bacterium]